MNFSHGKMDALWVVTGETKSFSMEQNTSALIRLFFLVFNKLKFGAFGRMLRKSVENLFGNCPKTPAAEEQVAVGTVRAISTSLII